MRQKTESLLEKVQRCDSLPSVPAAVRFVLSMRDDDRVDINEFANVISIDGPLSARLLQAANSTAQGQRTPVASISRAIVVLGIKASVIIVLSSAIRSSVQASRTDGFDYAQHARRSAYSATAARCLAERFLAHRADDCFVAALLMDVGMLVMDQLIGATYADIVKKAASHTQLSTLEARHCQTTHAAVSGMLAEHWKFPSMLAVPMASHHNPKSVKDPETRAAAEICYYAGCCADVFLDEAGDKDNVKSLRAELCQRYSMDESMCDAMLRDVGRRTTELAGLLSVKLNQNAEYDQILARANERLVDMTLAEQQRQRDRGVANRRRAPRVRREGKMSIIRFSDGLPGPAEPVRIRDLSSSGIGFTHESEMPVGTQFILELPLSQGDVKTLEYAVRRCDRDDAGRWMIGAELTTVPKVRSERKTDAA